MSILIFNFLICLILAYVLYLGSPKSVFIKDKLYFAYALILLVFFHGFIDPYSVPDVEVYESVFDRLASKSIFGAFSDGDDSAYGENFEVGFKFYLGIIANIWHNIYFFLIVNSIVLCLLYLRFFKKYSPLFGISVILFLLLPFDQSIFVIRQHLSLAILLLSYDYIIEQKFWKFMLVVIVAMLFHTSSVVFIPVYFLYKVRSKKILAILLFAGFLAALALRYVFTLISAVMAYSERYSAYADEADDINVGVAAKGIIMFAVLFFYCWTLRGRIWQDGINRLVFVLSLWGTLFNLVIGEAGAGRIFLSYYFIMLIQIPIIIVNIENKVMKSLFVFGTIACFAIFSYILSAEARSLEDYSLMF